LLTPITLGPHDSSEDIMQLRRSVFALIAGGLLFSSAAADAQQPRESAQNLAVQVVAGAAKVMTDVKYGLHRRHVMDVWLARSDKLTPVLVSIHGGGFRAGNKSVEPALRNQCLAAGISVVAISYRLSQDAIAPASFHDSARAIQFIRHNANEWNLDPGRIAATGGSAGAGLSLWLGFHDDLADPDSSDPVLRQSSRLSGMVVNDGQSSYDPRVIRDLFPGTDTYKHPALNLLYDVDLDQLDNLTAEKYKLFEEVSPINHLTKDDPPAMLIYRNPLDAQITSQEIGAHHPKFGVLLKEKMDVLAIRCEVYAAGKKMGGGQTTTPIEFLKQVLGVQ
jgi:acetyl esterase